MTETKKLLELRKKSKKKKPLFVTKDTHKKSRVPYKWKKPRGKHSPVRQRYKGKSKLVSIGYGSPKAVKGMHSSGLQRVIVQNKKQLENIDSQQQGIIISKTMGNKKRIELIKLALEKKISVLNLKDTKKHLEKLESQFNERKEFKKKKLTEKEKKETAKKKASEEMKKKEKEEKNEGKKPVEEIKKEIEEKKKETEKTLIKKQ